MHSMRALLTPTVETLSHPAPNAIWRTAGIAAVGFALYGFTVGYWRSPLMGCYVALKMPLLIALTLGCNSLLNGLLGLLLGSGLGLKQSLHALLGGFAISGLILGSLAPICFFLAIQVPPPDSPEAVTAHSAYLLVHVAFIAVAGLVGVVRLASLLEAYSNSRKIARVTLGAWIAGNVFLGAQFSWILRPFFGSPGLEVAFLRDHPMQGNFYEAVWRAMFRLIADLSIEQQFCIGLAAMIAILIFSKTRTEPTKP